MKITYVGQTKCLKVDGRLFVLSDASEDAATQIEWARGVLAKPAVVYPNGRNSHEVAGKVIDRAEDVLICYMLVTA